MRHYCERTVPIAKAPVQIDYATPAKRDPADRFAGLIFGAVIGLVVAGFLAFGVVSLLPLALSTTIVANAVIGIFPVAIACGAIIGFPHPPGSRKKTQ